MKKYLNIELKKLSKIKYKYIGKIRNKLFMIVLMSITYRMWVNLGKMRMGMRMGMGMRLDLGLVEIILRIFKQSILVEMLSKFMSRLKYLVRRIKH